MNEDRVPAALYNYLVIEECGIKPEFSELSEPVKDQYRKWAASIIESIREPSQAMLRSYSHALRVYIHSIPEAERAGRWGLCGRQGYIIPDHEKARARWYAMHAALLAECSRVQLNSTQGHTKDKTAPKGKQNGQEGTKSP